MDRYQQAEAFIEAIDTRVDELLRTSGLIKQYVGTIVTIVPSKRRMKVKIVGHDNIFTFPYRDYLDPLIGKKLNEGDSVFIQSPIGNLSSGVIVDRFYGRDV